MGQGLPTLSLRSHQGRVDGLTRVQIWGVLTGGVMSHFWKGTAFLGMDDPEPVPSPLWALPIEYRGGGPDKKPLTSPSNLTPCLWEIVKS